MFDANENRSNSSHQKVPIDILRIIAPTSFNLTRLVIENSSIVYIISLIMLNHLEVRTVSALKSKSPVLIIPGSHNLSSRVGLNVNLLEVHVIPLVFVLELSLPHLNIIISFKRLVMIYVRLLSIIHRFFLPPPPCLSIELRGPLLSSSSASASGCPPEEVSSCVPCRPNQSIGCPFPSTISKGFYRTPLPTCTSPSAADSPRLKFPYYTSTYSSD